MNWQQFHNGQEIRSVANEGAHDSEEGECYILTHKHLLSTGSELGADGTATTLKCWGHRSLTLRVTETTIRQEVL